MPTYHIAIVAIAAGIAGCSPQRTGSPASSPAAAASPRITGLPVTITVKLTEGQKIEQLIATVEHLDGGVFIRNGAEHSAKEAADHLRQKLKAARGGIASASQFIDLIASQSSLTGEKYKIRMPNGETLDARDYLNAELAKLQSSR